MKTQNKTISCLHFVKAGNMFPNDPTVKSNIEKYQQLTQPKDTSGN
jgi:hypothetical protein